MLKAVDLPMLSLVSSGLPERDERKGLGTASGSVDGTVPQLPTIERSEATIFRIEGRKPLWIFCLDARNPAEGPLVK